MISFYLVIVIFLFILAVSDLVVGVSNDAVNFLNSAVGSKVSTWRTILIVAALGVIVGCTFSSGMMEVARKGIFHPEYFYFSEIILLFLAVMVTDIILLDTFNTFGMPTSTTVSIVFELLGAAVAFSVIKIYTDPNALGLGEYINSGKALAIISGILLSVVVAFTVGVIVQYLTRLLFSFDYEKTMKYWGGLWGGFALSAITFFMLVKGAKGVSFMDSAMKESISNNAFLIILGSFVFWAVVIQLLVWFTKVNVMKVIVLIGTFSLAMAFAGNDLVNFIGVPLAGYNSYELYMASGAEADGFLMGDLAGKVPTPTILLLLAGVVMTITLWTSKKARTVVKTSLDLGRQYEGSERFASYAVSRSLVRNFAKMANGVNNMLPSRFKSGVKNRFDERPFLTMQAQFSPDDAPSFDMIRAASTLVVASILISIGTSLKLPLSTTYVTFMTFMGTSLADGAWGRESAVYRVSGVLSVIGGWFFTAFSAFTVAFIIANIFHFGGNIAILAVLAVVAYLIYRTHKYHSTRIEEQLEFEKSLRAGGLTKEKVLKISSDTLQRYLGSYIEIIDETIDGLANEDLVQLNKTNTKFKSVYLKSARLQSIANNYLDQIDDDEMDVAHLLILAQDYIHEMANGVRNIIKPSLNHVDNNHKPLLDAQIGELRTLQSALKARLQATIKTYDSEDEDFAKEVLLDMDAYVNLLRDTRKKQIKRIKKHEIGTRNSLLFLNHLGEFRNVGWFASRLVRVYQDLILLPDEGTVPTNDVPEDVDIDTTDAGTTGVDDKPTT
ncbi:MAG: inorganic phosphate transporter [Bacteroidia bacterium]|nr:inorganic phosphate transporter [Bacteroidia bacterium]